MATSGYVRQSMSSYFDFYIYWEVQSQSIENNTSTVYLSWGTEKKRSNSGTYNLISANITAKYENTTYKNADYVSWDMRSSAVGAQKSLANTTVTINHNSDGSKNLYVYGYFDCGNLSLAKSAEISSYIALPTIPRASAIKATSDFVGNKSKITIDKKSPDFTTTVSYKIAGQSSFTAIQTKSTNTQIEWTIPTTCYSLMGTSSKTVNITFQCITYQGDTQIGSAATTTITATAVESACKPTVTYTVTYGTDTNNLTGATNKGIMNYSTVTIGITATAKNSATISNRKVTLGGVTKSGTSVSFSKLADNKFTYTVTDSRGFTTTGTVNLTVVNYFVPTVIFTATPPDVQTGTTAISLKGDWFNGSFGSVTNALTVQYGYKESSASSYTWVTVSTTKSGNTFTGSAQVALDATKVYYISARVKDSATTTYQQGAEQKLQTWPIINFGKNFINMNTKTNFGGKAEFRGEANVRDKLILDNNKWVYGYKSNGTDYNSILGVSSSDKVGLGSSTMPLVIHSSEKVPVDVGLDAPVLYESGTAISAKYIQKTWVGLGSGSVSSTSTKTFTDNYQCAQYVVTFGDGNGWWSVIVPGNFANGTTVRGWAQSNSYGFTMNRSGTSVTLKTDSSAAITCYVSGIR